MRIGTQVAWFSWPGAPATIGPTVASIARGADEAGMSSLWFMDHFWQIEPVGPPELDMLEAYSTLSYAAALTSRIDLGVLVTGVTYRHPGILAKTVTTLDVLSGGRARLGMGAAWHEEEHLGLGIPFPRTPERFERLEETVRICRQMFDGDDTAFHGKHYRLERPPQLAATTAPDSHPHRWRRREEDTAARRQPCGRVQHLRHDRRQGPREVRRHGPSL